MTTTQIKRLSHYRLFTVRKELGLTQMEMARKLNTPLPTYKDWEQNKARIPGAIKPLIEFILEKNRAKA